MPVLLVTDGQTQRGCGLLQKNFLSRQRWDTREELRLAIVTWIEKTYRRRLGRLTPIEFDLLHDQLATVA